MRIRVLSLLFLLLASPALAQQQPDDRYKADVLLVVAHPDDETAVASWIARAVFDEGRRVAVVFTTWGEGGRNAIGVERGAAMGAIREIEARRALASLGVDLVWFLDGRDTATQNAMLSLANWPHGAVLEQTVRAIRLTRPEVVMAWLPRNVAGENHGDHQAAGIVATEAFDLAGDPAAFAGQTAPPRLRFPTENLRLWQPKKLYFFTDAFDSSFMDGRGPSYDGSEVSPSRKAPYAYFALRAASFHRSQFAGFLTPPLLDAIAREDVKGALEIVEKQRGGRRERTRLLLGKSLVGGSATGDVFENVRTGPIPFSPPQREAASPSTGALSLGGSFDFYPTFWRAHGLGALAGLGAPEIAVRPASELHVNLLVRNDAAAPRDVVVALDGPLPEGWSAQPLPERITLAPGEQYLVQPVLTSPGANGTATLTWVARSGAVEIGRTTLRVVVRPGAMPH